MRQPDATAAAMRRHPCVRRIVRKWRELTGGGRDRARCRRTLVGCSGGADSSALAIALGAYSEAVVLGHVVHDLRPREEALADRNAARELAEGLGLRFSEREIRIGAGNAESGARRLRYRALVELATECGCGFVATAHHADDQLETLLMRLLRGAGPAGLAGVAPVRPLTDDVRLIRPMLELTRAEAESVCTAAGWMWREDATNLDQARVRARLRARVLPELRDIAPAGAARAAHAAELLRQAAEILDAQAAALLADASRAAPQARGETTLDRGVLAAAPELLAGEAIRLAHGELFAGRHADRLAARVLSRIVGAIRVGAGDGRRFDLREGAIIVDRRRVRLIRSDR